MRKQKRGAALLLALSMMALGVSPVFAETLPDREPLIEEIAELGNGNGIIAAAPGEVCVVTSAEAREESGDEAGDTGTPSEAQKISGDDDSERKELVSYIDERGNERSTYCTILDSSDEGLYELKSRWYAVEGSVNFPASVQIGPNVHLILKDGSSMSVRYYFEMYQGSNLSIYGQKEGTGILTFPSNYGTEGTITINGGTVNAGAINSTTIINGGTVNTTSEFGGQSIIINGGTVNANAEVDRSGINGNGVEINGGTVTATGLRDGAGISGKVIRITGGTVIATAGDDGAGIGGEYGQSGGDITITGGTVTATGKNYGAGIGGGEWGSGGNITITGGTVTATSGGSGAGIGAGAWGKDGGTIKISGGTVTANGVLSGAGIGGGYGGPGGDVTISGGKVTATGGYYDCEGIGRGLSTYDSGTLSLENDSLMVFAGGSQEDAKKTSIQAYIASRDTFVCFDRKTEYRVVHQWQKVDGSGYEPKEEEILEGIAGLQTEAMQKVYEGFTCTGVKQMPVSADGSTAVEIKYDRNSYTISFDLNGHGKKVPADVTALFGAPVPRPEDPVVSGYYLDGWYEDKACTEEKVFTFGTMPAGDMTLYAKWVKGKRPRPKDSDSGSSSEEQYSRSYSEKWYTDESGGWKIRNGKGQDIKNAWLCDDAVVTNGQNVWYLLGSDGVMVTAGLVQDKTGNFYSLETEHNGYFGMMRYKNGYYNCRGQQVYLTFHQIHDGSFGAVTNQEGIEKLKAIYGETRFDIGNENAVYTKSF